MVKELARMGHIVLVERILAADKNVQRRTQAAPRPTSLLPRAGDGAREAGLQRRVDGADVDPQFQGAGRGYAQEFASEQTSLDLAPLSREVSSTVRTEAFDEFRPVLAQAILRVDQ